MLRNLYGAKAPLEWPRPASPVLWSIRLRGIHMTVRFFFMPYRQWIAAEIGEKAENTAFTCKTSGALV